MSDRREQATQEETIIKGGRKPSGEVADERTAPVGAFSDELRAGRERAGLAQSALARLVGVDASYINRLEKGEREAPKSDLVGALARAIGLNGDATDRLLVSAGAPPRALAALNPLDPTLLLVARALGDPDLDPSDKDELRLVVELITRRYHVRQ